MPTFKITIKRTTTEYHYAYKDIQAETESEANDIAREECTGYKCNELEWEDEDSDASYEVESVEEIED